MTQRERRSVDSVAGSGVLWAVVALAALLLAALLLAAPATAQEPALQEELRLGLDFEKVSKLTLKMRRAELDSAPPIPPSGSEIDPYRFSVEVNRYHPERALAESWIIARCKPTTPPVNHDVEIHGFRLMELELVLYGSENEVLMDTSETPALDSAICDLSQLPDHSFFQIPSHMVWEGFRITASPRESLGQGAEITEITW